MRYDVKNLPIMALLPAVSRAEDMLARLDERCLRHVVADGFRTRGHFFDAAAALWVGGELVHVEDLVLHDAHMDSRAPTHELIIAHGVLRARQRLWNAPADWGLSVGGMSALSSADATETATPRPLAIDAPEAAGSDGDADDEGRPSSATDDALSAAFAEIDAVIARSQRVLDGDLVRPKTPETTGRDPLGLVHDEDWDEPARLAVWRDAMREADLMPPSLGAALLFDAWERIEPLRRQHWLGSLFTAAYLRRRGKVTSHLFSLNTGLKTIRHERRRSADRTTRLIACLDAMAEAADAGLKELDRLALAKTQMDLRLKDRRSNSSLPDVIELILSRPIVSANMITRHVGVTPRGALKLVDALGIREMTGRGRYRGWGIS